MRLWLDDIRPMPHGYTHHARSVNEARKMIEVAETSNDKIELISLDHDLGDYASDGGDGIKLMDYLIMKDTFYPVEFHTANPVGRANMQRIKDRWWPN